MQKKFFALAFTALFFAACSSGGSDSSGTSSSSYVPPTPEPDPGVNVEAEFDARLTGSSHEYLEIWFNAQINIEGGFDSVLIKLDGALQNADKKNIEGSKSFSWDTDEKGRIDVSGKACGGEMLVNYEVYANSKPTPQKGGSINLTRERDKCEIPSSSSEASSSSVVSIPFVPLLFDGEETFTINSTTGAVLGTATVYFDKGGNHDALKVTGSGVTISDSFSQGEGYGCTEFYYSTSLSPNTSNTSELVPCVGANYESNTADYNFTEYYLVKTTEGTEWQAGWFLIMSESNPVNTNSIDIKAWTVN